MLLLNVIDYQLFEAFLDQHSQHDFFVTVSFMSCFEGVQLISTVLNLLMDGNVANEPNKITTNERTE